MDKKIDEPFVIAKNEQHNVRITNEEWFEISRALEPHHAVFYKIWEMGRPVFNSDIDTAAVQFDKHGEFIWFHFNPHFWKRLQFKDKLFVICHESLHIILNHGVRTRDASSHQATNVALDIVVNHSLVNGFGFVKSNIEDWQDYCWIDTVFPEKKPTPRENESYEYYYNLFEKVYGDFGMGDGEGGGPGVLDDHSMMGKDADGNEVDWGKAIDNLNSSLTEEEKESLKSTIKKHFTQDPEASDEKEAGIGTGTWTFINIPKVPPKKKWETVIKKWSKKYYKPLDKDEEQWARIHRRMVLLPRKMFLPSEMEVDERDYEKTKIDVWFFLDTSGSCWDLKERFFTAAASLPAERFNLRLFCFDTAVHETTLDSKKVYGGGGTCFKILENRIQKEVKEGGNYPAGVFVITDGYGSQIKPEYPQNWYWFLSVDYRAYIPKECNIFKLSDYE